jgi:hypothetical protein
VGIWFDGKEMQAVEDKKPVDPAQIWSWVCTKPITEAEFRRVERGEGWSDDIEAAAPDATTAPAAEQDAAPNSNNPPADEVEADEVASAIKAAEAALKNPVVTQADCDKLGNHRDRLSGLYKSQEVKRVAEKQPHLDAGKKVDAHYQPILAGIETVGQKLKKAITDFLLAERARLQKEQDEANRIAKEKADAAAKALAEKRAEAEANNQPLPEPEPEPEPVKAPEPIKVKAGTTGRATALRTFKSAVIEDYTKALNALADNAEIKALVQTLADRSARSDIALPGCKIKTEERAS